jgi:hypothetical protein
MSGEPRFELIYAPNVKSHLKTIEPKYYSLIEKEIATRLRFEPTAITKNRKPLKPPGLFGGDWELRFRPDNRFRVYYQVHSDLSQVHILALGVKAGNRIEIGWEEFEL